MRTIKYIFVVGSAISLMVLAFSCKQKHFEYKEAASPLYIDPIYNGSTDPMVCYNPISGSYYMYYTSRRSNVPGLGGIESVHGSPIGMAESKDGGASWEYIGDCNIDYHPDENPTYWAPEVIFHDGLFHMYLTYVPGVFDTWAHPRDIVHLTSKNGKDFHAESVLQLSDDHVIDACIIQKPDGGWRLWYNNETDGKSIYYADSPDLYRWIDQGKVTSVSANGEGPNVFYFQGQYYMIVDEWKGLSVFLSDDLTEWTKQEGKYLVDGNDWQRRGNHADVEVVDGHAYLFYFSGWTEQDPESGEIRRKRGSAVYVAELLLDHQNKLYCDTTSPCLINLMSDK
jgi:hypothetical protein